MNGLNRSRGAGKILPEVKMPANLTPQYFEAERKYKEAVSPRDRLRALREMLSVIPKHKGTEKLQADIKRRISRTTEEIQQAKKSGGGKRHGEYVRRSGAGQVVLIGPANSGKSSIVDKLTHAAPEIAAYPYTTMKVLPAMMPYEDIQIQLVDMPPITETHYEGWFTNIIRESDIVLLVLGLADLDPDKSLAVVLDRLEKVGLKLTALDADPDTPDYRTTEKKTLMVVNKIDLGGADIFIDIVKPVSGDLPIHQISCETGEGLEALRQTIFEMLGIVRVYSKAPHKEPDLSKPYVVKRGTTVIEMARIVHRDFHDNLKFARVWGHTKIDGLAVEKDHVLDDRDVIEFHT
jgi:ribosome-interacting GTPase 1